MDMKKGITLVLLTIGLHSLFPSCLAGQSYNTSFGMRLGTDWGLTVKQRVAKKVTLEGILQSSLQREEALVTLLAEQHLPFLTRRVNAYAGGGLHKGWGSGQGVEDYRDPFGISVIGGIELTLARINLSYDIKPAINLVGGERTVYTQTAVSIRYVVDKRPWLVDKKKQRKRKREREKRRRKGEGFNWRFWEKD